MEDRVLLCARSVGLALFDSQTQKAALLGSRLSGMELMLSWEWYPQAPLNSASPQVGGWLSFGTWLWEAEDTHLVHLRPPPWL